MSGSGSSPRASRRRQGDARHDAGLVDVQTELRNAVRASSLRADTAHAVVEYAAENVMFTVRDVQAAIGVSYPRANGLVGDLVRIGILTPLDPEHVYRRRFYAPKVLDALLGGAT